MFFIKWLIKYYPINVGIVPDQVDRLYSKKHFKVSGNSLMGLTDYMESLIEKRNKENLQTSKRPKAPSP